MNTTWYQHFIWMIAAAALGFLIPALFSGQLQLPRELYLIPYAGLAGAFLYAYSRTIELDVLPFVRSNWYWGLLGALVAGIFVVKNVYSQPVSPHATGARLVFELLWLGVVYGALDGLLLSVFPVVASWKAFAALNWTLSWQGKLAAGVVGLVASLLLTAAYHLGYPEYRSAAVGAPVFGNGVMSLAYLLSSNPLAAVFSHVAMHIAGVLHGPASVVQLPPHY